MIPYWLFCVLVVTHLAMFVMGAFGYHGIRVLAARPFYQPQKNAAAHEARLQALATKMAQQEAKSALFNHLGPMADVPIQQQIIPHGDGRPPKEEAFAPMVKK